MSTLSIELRVSPGLAHGFDLSSVHYGLLLHWREPAGTSTRDVLHFHSFRSEVGDLLACADVQVDRDRLEFERGDGTDLDTRLVRLSVFKVELDGVSPLGRPALQQVYVLAKAKGKSVLTTALGLSLFISKGNAIDVRHCVGSGAPLQSIWATSEWLNSKVVETIPYQGDIEAFVKDIQAAINKIVTDAEEARHALTKERELQLLGKDGALAEPPEQGKVVEPIEPVKVAKPEKETAATPVIKSVSHKKWYVIVGAVTVLGLLASQWSSKEPAGASKNTRIDAPHIRVGDTYLFESRHVTHPSRSYTGERKVIAVRDGKVTATIRYLQSGYTFRVVFDNQWNVIASRADDGGGSDYSPPIKYFDFPLFPGKTWVTQSEERDVKTGKSRIHKMNGLVGNWEEVTVPAGRFQGIKITVNTEHKNGNDVVSTEDISWYVPEVRRTVRTQLTSVNQRTGERQVQHILLSNFKSSSN